jgi:hypothetical protein
MAPPDRGPHEARAFRLLLTGRSDREVDPLSCLFSRGFLDQDAYDAGRRYAATTAISRHAFGISSASVADLWRRMIAGTVDGDVPGFRTLRTPDDAPPGSIEAARRRLDRMNAELQRRGEDETIRRTVISITVDARWTGWCKRLLCRIPELPGDWRSLGALREGLARLAALRFTRRAAPAEHIQSNEIAAE